MNRKYEIQKRRTEVAHWYLKGYHQQEIADKVNVTRQQVSHDLKKIHEQWVRESLDDIGKAKYKELAKLDKLEQTYWEAWDKSITDYQQKTTKQKGNPIGENGGTTIKTKELEETKKNMVVYGNPAYLNGIERCIELRCKILGINAPTKLEHSGEIKSSIGEIPIVITMQEQKNKLDEEMLSDNVNV